MSQPRRGYRRSRMAAARSTRRRDVRSSGEYEQAGNDLRPPGELRLYDLWGKADLLVVLPQRCFDRRHLGHDHPAQTREQVGKAAEEHGVAFVEQAIEGAAPPPDVPGSAGFNGAEGEPNGPDRIRLT
jgi:hypothetical protein